MLRLVRRPLAEFLTSEQRSALTERMEGAREIAVDVEITGVQRTKRCRSRWDDFRRGRTSLGVFEVMWSELLAMGFNKCAFCEIPEPTTVEHLDPIARAPQCTFDWLNLLAACSTCNTHREHSGIDAPPFDPSRKEPLDLFGWDEYGNFAPRPGSSHEVDALVEAYGLHRYRRERELVVQVLRQQLTLLIMEESERENTIEMLGKLLAPEKAWIGPIREYLLRPPSKDDALLIQGTLQLLPDFRRWVDPWLRPPEWAPEWWHDVAAVRSE